MWPLRNGRQASGQCELGSSVSCSACMRTAPRECDGVSGAFTRQLRLRNSCTPLFVILNCCKGVQSGCRVRGEVCVMIAACWQPCRVLAVPLRHYPDRFVCPDLSSAPHIKLSPAVRAPSPITNLHPRSAAGAHSREPLHIEIGHGRAPRLRRFPVFA